MLFRLTRNPAKGCFAEIATLVGLVLNILKIISFFTEAGDVEIPLLSPILRDFDFIKEDPFWWGLLIFYGLTIVMMFCLRYLEGRVHQPIGMLGAFSAGGFAVVFFSPIFIYPFFSTFSIPINIQGAVIGLVMIIPSIVVGWILYHFFNR